MTRPGKKYSIKRRRREDSKVTPPWHSEQSLTGKQGTRRREGNYLYHPEDQLVKKEKKKQKKTRTKVNLLEPWESRKTGSQPPSHFQRSPKGEAKTEYDQKVQDGQNHLKIDKTIIRKEVIATQGNILRKRTLKTEYRKMRLKVQKRHGEDSGDSLLTRSDGVISYITGKK